jgi:hypothetical protein
LALAAAPAAAQEYIGVIKRTSGQVLIDRDGVKLAPSAGTEVKQGDRVITGPDGYAHIKLRGAAPLSVSPDADILLDRYAAGPVSTQRTPSGLVGRLASFLAVNRQRH